jgi:hypothetical protein
MVEMESALSIVVAPAALCSYNEKRAGCGALFHTTVTRWLPSSSTT